MKSKILFSPIKTIVWPFLAKENDLWTGDVVADAGSSDGTAVYTTIAALDKMTPESRLGSILSFDTTPFGELPGYRAEVKVRDLFAAFVHQLTTLGCDCFKAEELMP